MRTNSKYRPIGVSLVALAVAFGAYRTQAGGGDHTAASMTDMQGALPLRTEQAPAPQAADRGQTERGQRDSQIQAALARLEAEAKRGIFAAQMRLARIYSQGRETPRNDAKAFLYYRQVADQNADIDIYHPAAKYVAEAFRALAGYYRTGVPALNLAPDRAREGQLLQQGASYFQDPASQFMLAKMYLNGDGVTRNTAIGVRWLVNASRRRYAPAQAVLGDLLWDGKGVKSSPGEGLALLVLAKDNAAPEDAGWIAALCDKAMAEANEVQTKIAQKVLAKFEKLYRLKAGVALRITRPGQQAADPLKSQAETLKSQDGLEAGALLGLFGNDDIPSGAFEAPGVAPGEFDRLPMIGPLNGPGGGGDAVPSLHGMMTGFAPQAGGVAPASVATPGEGRGGLSR